ncbi:MAG: hypothetical protein HYT28_02385 [Parcubacteria group bacterium]|nr:hypothetical protein [Parcubacteria group bacterium]
MHTFSNKKIHIFILLFSAMFLPFSVSASTAYIDTGHTDFFVGDTILFSVRVDSENKDINAVDGEVLLDHAARSVSLIDINTASSEFSLWPLKPLPSERNMSISFVGGSPGGFNSKDAVIFNIVLKLEKEGPITLTPSDFSVYLHDGKGTKDDVHAKQLAINVLPKKPDSQPVDDWNNVISNDKTPPEFIEAIIDRDPYIFDNQYFVSFFAVDKDAGVAYYEIKENDLDFVHAESPHLLQDQSLKSVVQIKAVDKAGNEIFVTPKLAPVPITGIPYKTYLVWVLVILVILAFIFWLLRFWTTTLKKNVQK